MEDDQLNLTFAALADPTRRAMLRQLAAGEATVGELAAPHAMSLPAISRHLKVLEHAGLIVKGRDAQRRPCQLDPRPLRVVDDWMDAYRAFFEPRFDRLDEQLRAETAAVGARDIGARPTRSLTNEGDSDEQHRD